MNEVGLFCLGSQNFVGLGLFISFLFPVLVIDTNTFFSFHITIYISVVFGLDSLCLIELLWCFHKALAWILVKVHRCYVRKNEPSRTPERHQS